MKLYEYAVLCNEKLDRDGEAVEKARILIEPSCILARNDAQAQLIAAQSIPASEIEENLDRIEVVVRPF